MAGVYTDTHCNHIAGLITRYALADGFHPPDNFMPRHQRENLIAHDAFNNVDIDMAKTAIQNVDIDILLAKRAPQASTLPACVITLSRNSIRAYGAAGTPRTRTA